MKFCRKMSLCNKLNQNMQIWTLEKLLSLSPKTLICQNITINSKSWKSKSSRNGYSLSIVRRQIFIREWVHCLTTYQKKTSKTKFSASHTSKIRQNKKLKFLAQKISTKKISQFVFYPLKICSLIWEWYSQYKRFSKIKFHQNHISMFWIKSWFNIIKTDTKNLNKNKLISMTRSQTCLEDS